MSSKEGVVQQFIKSSKYKDKFSGLTADTPEFDSRWKDIAKADPEFSSAQHEFIKKTHFDPAMARLKKGGMDLSKKGAAVQDALWSTSVHTGAGDSKGGAVSIFQNALKGQDVSKLSDEQIVSAVQDYKFTNNSRLFKSSSLKTQKAVATRAIEEKKNLVALAKRTGVVTTNDGMPNDLTKITTAPVIASMGNAAAITMPRISPPPILPDAPSIQTKLNSTKLPLIKEQGTSTMVGQDLSDRKIAHIVTGGLFS